MIHVQCYQGTDGRYQISGLSGVFGDAEGYGPYAAVRAADLGAVEFHRRALELGAEHHGQFRVVVDAEQLPAMRALAAEVFGMDWEQSARESKVAHLAGPAGLRGAA